MIGFAAAFLLVFGIFGFSNPALAAQIPFVGRIFQIVGKQLSYPGDYSEHAVPLAPENEDISADTAGQKGTNDLSHEIGGNAGKNADSAIYSQTCGDVTITLSEANYSEMAMCFSLELYSEKGFPEDFDRVKNMEDSQMSYNSLYLSSRQTFDFSQADSSLYSTDIYNCSMEEGLPTPYYIEGIFVDSHTFLGVIRVDLENIRECFQIDRMPPEFTYSLVIEKFCGDLNEIEEEETTDPDTGETVIIPNNVKKYYEGPWSFTIPVSLDTENTVVREIMDTNAEGVGISAVTKTAYEIKADIILPEGKQPYDYVVAITDADGRLMESQGEIAEIYSIYGRNTDTVHVYVVDYYTYMDECKGKNAYRLPEKALYQTTITF